MMERYAALRFNNFHPVSGWGSCLGGDEACNLAKWKFHATLSERW